MDNETDLKIELISSEEDDSHLTDVHPYQLNTYGSDMTVELLSKKIDDDEIHITPFQRNYVWPPKKASRLIESFLLGLPVPQIFLFLEKDQRYIVVDGQQRLRSINYFLNEKFPGDKPFKLVGVHEKWSNLTFSELKEEDQRKLRNSILRSSIFEQSVPDDDTSIYQIFERLNTGGMPLNSQEIRNALTRGPINQFLIDVNKISSWRKLLGKADPDTRMKDVEMILRFFALYEKRSKYTKSMAIFLNRYMEENREINEARQSELKQLFISLIDYAYKKFGKNAFRIKSGFNVAVFDSVMIALSATDLKKLKEPKRKLEMLKKDTEFLEYVSKHTTDSQVVLGRIRLAAKYLK